MIVLLLLHCNKCCFSSSMNFLHSYNYLHWQCRIMLVPSIFIPQKKNKKNKKLPSMYKRYGFDSHSLSLSLSLYIYIYNPDSHAHRSHFFFFPQFIGATLGTSGIKFQTHNKRVDMQNTAGCVIIEYFPCGTLKSYLIKNRERKLAFKNVVRIALDLAEGSDKFLSHFNSLTFL